MRALILTVALLAGCSTVLGIDDPRSQYVGDDGMGDDGTTPILKSIEVTPNPLSLPLGATQQLTAIATYKDNSTADVTEQTTWAVDGGGALVVSSSGMARAVGEGSASITATIGEVAGAAIASVGAAAPDQLQFSFPDFKILQQQSARFRVRVHLTDGGSQDATLAVSYTSTDDAIAKISGPGRVDGQLQAGTVTINAGLGNVVGSVRVTVAAQQCHPMINEIATGGPLSAADEWVEVINPCTVPILVEGWSLVYRGANVIGTTDSNLMLTLHGTMAPGEIRLFCGLDYPGIDDGYWTAISGLMGQNNGAVGLRSGPKDTGTLVDAIAYGTISAGHPFIETNPAGAMLNGKSAARQPFDGRDDGDNTTDFVILQTPTPRAPNVP